MSKVSPKYWAVSYEMRYEDEGRWSPMREVITSPHPLHWADKYAEEHRVEVRLLHWEILSPTEAAWLRKALDQ